MFESRRSQVGAFAVVLTLVVALAVGMKGLRKETSLDAFVPDDSPALALRQHVEARFGLNEPIAIAYVGSEPQSALAPAVLREVRAVSALLQAQPGIDPDQVMSLATRSWVAAEDDAIEVRRLLPEGAIDERTAAAVLRGLDAAPGYRGVLLSDDASGAMILAEVRTGFDAGEVYQRVEALIRDRPLPAGVAVHIAGQATISGYLSRHIDQDTRKLIPAGVLLSLLLMTLLLRSWTALAVGVLILVGTLLGTLGLMGWLGKPIYVITSSLPVVLLCISIADSIHLLARTRQLRRAGLLPAPAIGQALHELIRPLTLTTLTTMGGFAGLSLGSQIPAMQQYGLFAAFGVGMAWVLTVAGAPPLYIWLSRNRVLVSGSTAPAAGAAPGWSRVVAGVSGRAPRRLLLTAGGLIAVGAWGLSLLEFNYERVRNFGQTSEVFQANAAINQRFSGTHNLDVYLQSDTQDLIEPALVERIERLQEWMRGPGGMQDSLSFVDLVRDTHRATNPDDTQRLPASADEIEQTLFLFEISAAPGELSQRISADRREALVRGFLRTDNFQQVAPQVEALQAEARRLFAGSGVSAQVTGPVYVTTSWVGPLYGNTVLGIAIAVTLVGLGAMLVFRSVRDGLLCLMPVSMAVLFVFGVMGLFGVWLDVVTSMFATICIGLGVDFAIHMLHAIGLARARGLSGVAMLEDVYARIGAPLTFNALALTGGMLVAVLSEIPPVGYFGALTGVAVMSAYVATLLTLPAIFALYTARRVTRDELSLETHG